MDIPSVLKVFHSILLPKPGVNSPPLFKISDPFNEVTDDGIEWIDLNLGTDYPKKLSELENDCNFISNFVLDNMLSQKVDKINGMGLSSNDFSLEYKEKLCGIEDDGGRNNIILAYGYFDNITSRPSININ